MLLGVDRITIDIPEEMLRKPLHATIMTATEPAAKNPVPHHLNRCGFPTRSPHYRSTRAEPPPTSFFTSSVVAMVVSPGVVMASAPWAAPYSTACLASLNSMKP